MVRQDLPACLQTVKHVYTYIDSLVEDLQGEELSVRVLAVHEDAVDASPRICIRLKLVQDSVCLSHLHRVSHNQEAPHTGANTYHLSVIREHVVHDCVEGLESRLVERPAEVQ